MKITDVKVYAIQTPIAEPFYYSMGYVNRRSSVIVEIETDEGITGYGEALCHGQQPVQVSAAMIYYEYRPLLLGRDPLQREPIWEMLYSRTRPYGQGGIAVNALSGVDIALWDIAGKVMGQPVYNLLGGAFRTEVDCYATGFHRKDSLSYPEALLEEAECHMKNGFRAMKMKAGFGVEQEVECIKALRNFLPRDICLMVDFNCAYSFGPARKLVYALEECDLFFLEELLVPEDIEGYVKLREISRNYIAGGENVFTKQTYRRYMEAGALDIIQPDISSSGGFTELRKIAALAEAYQVLMFPHVWGSGISIAAALQLLATLPPEPLIFRPIEPMLEFDHAQHPFRMDIIRDGICMESGKIQIPDGPGLGVQVDRELIKAYAVDF